jgi:hypothetical protein
LWRLLFSLGIIPVDPSLVPIFEAATKERFAALTEWRRSSGNRRMFLVHFENRTSSTRSSSCNGPGIDVSLHKGTILKGMLPKLKSSKYILVYGSSLETFWYTYIYPIHIFTPPSIPSSWDGIGYSVTIFSPKRPLCFPYTTVDWKWRTGEMRIDRGILSPHEKKKNLSISICPPIYFI